MIKQGKFRFFSKSYWLVAVISLAVVFSSFNLGATQIKILAPSEALASPDPVIADTFDNESKITSKVNLTVSGGNVYLAIAGQTCTSELPCSSTPQESGTNCTCLCNDECSGYFCGCSWSETYNWCGQPSCAAFCNYCGCAYCVSYVNYYYSSGTLISTNLLTGQDVASIDSFSYVASSIPSGSTLKVQFSQDASHWYNSTGVLDQWNTCSAGTQSISLSSLGWSGPNFYYKMAFTSGGSTTSVLTEIGVHYTETPSVLVPSTTASAADPVGATTATIRGQVTSDGGESCQYRFRYKKSGGDYVYTTWVGAETTGETFYEKITGLDPNSLYYFNSQIKNSAGESVWSNELQFTTTTLTACQYHNVFGYAWSENIGWVNFSCADRMTIGTGVNYGVDINEDTGIFSGYAWSENIGWVSFNEADLVGCPSAPCQTKVDLDTGAVTGWARFLSHGTNWDGWISLGQSSYDDVAVNYNLGEFSGYAWDSGYIGWISLNCADEGACVASPYKVETSFAPLPEITDLTNSFQACSQSRIPVFSWQTDALLPYDYEIQLCSQSDCAGAGDPIVSSQALNTSAVSWSPTCSFACDLAPYNGIQFGGNTYYGRVRARNREAEYWGNWVSSQFTSYDHAYPYPDFLCNGEDCQTAQIEEGVVVNLVSDSTTYDGQLSCTWTIPAFAQAVGQSLQFDGVDDRIRIPDNISLDLQEMTISLLLKTTHSGNDQGIVSKYDNHGEWNYQLYSDSTGKIKYNIGSDDVWENTLTSNQSINDGSWHLVTATYDQSQMRIYIDGLLDNSLSETRSLGDGGAALYLGAGTYDDDITTHYDESDVTFSGSMNEVRLYGRALDSTEVAEHYKGIFSDNSDLVLSLTFDESSGENVYDESGLDNHGILRPTYPTNSPSRVLDNLSFDCNVKVKFSSPPPGQGRNWPVTLAAKDTSDYSCSATKIVGIRVPLPEYKEISPIGWIKNFFAGSFTKIISIFTDNEKFWARSR
jgi:hypothetical protein